MVSLIGLGTVKLGRNVGVKYPAPFEVPGDAAAAALLERARELGVNLIDTAPAYGASEERLGALLGARRDEWVICTKAGEEFEGGASRFDFSPRAIRGSVERSLRRLRTDRVEIVLLHSGGDDEHAIARSGALEELERLKDEGKVGAVGASTKSAEGALLAASRCDVLMATFNPRDRADEPAIDAAGERGVGVLVKKGLLSGHLGLVEGEGPGDPVEASLRFIFRKGAVGSVVVGTINPAHLEHDVRAAERAIAGL